MTAVTDLHLADYAAFHKNYPSLVPHLLVPPATAPRNFALEERVAEIKTDIIAEMPYEYCGRDRHHSEDIIEHLQYDEPLNTRFSKLTRAAVRTGVSDAALGLYFRSLVEDAIKHQAELDLERDADDESDDLDVPANWR